MIQKIRFQYAILGSLFFAGLWSVLWAEDMWAVLLLMGLAYANNSFYSMVSRSSVRNSVLYHASATLVANFAFYFVLRQLVTENMTMALFIPYTVATVYGSVSGSRVSQVIEEFFGITTDPKKKNETQESKLALKILLVLLGGLGILIGIFSPMSWTTVVVAVLAFGDNITFAILRRSRNTSNATYHVVAALVKSAMWYFLYQTLSLRGMALELFVPYCFGAILGGMSGQKISEFVEVKIGATADAHLDPNVRWIQLVPWKLLGVLILATGGAVVLLDGSETVLMLAGLSGAQQLSFALTSRSRQRNNIVYHTVAAIFSNAVWFLTFRQIQIEQWTAELYLPYALGGTAGSVAGVGVSMGIEKALHIESDSKKSK